MAVSQRIDPISKRNEIRDAVDQQLLLWLLESDMMPVVVPNAFFADSVDAEESRRIQKLKAWLDYINPDVIVLSGGNNPGDHPARDQTECLLMERARRLGLPLLGICRGMQFMAVQAGASLEKVAGHVSARHQLVFTDGSMNCPEGVNSYHEWGLVECPDGYEVVATSEDGVIEAIAHRALPWQGWMWHPERENPFCKTDIDRFVAMMNSSKRDS